jgi:hypothetical protein
MWVKRIDIVGPHETFFLLVIYATKVNPEAPPPLSGASASRSSCDVRPTLRHSRRRILRPMVTMPFTTRPLLLTNVKCFDIMAWVLLFGSLGLFSASQQRFATWVQTSPSG